jgi:hypothetical protein
LWSSCPQRGTPKCENMMDIDVEPHKEGDGKCKIMLVKMALDILTN